MRSRCPSTSSNRRRRLLAAVVMAMMLSLIAAAPIAATPRVTNEVAEQLDAAEAVVFDVLGDIEAADATRCAAAIPHALAAVEIREAHHGKDWWETADARHRLAELRRLAEMSAEQRARLAEAMRLNDTVIEHFSAGSYTDALQVARQVMQIRRQVLDDSHPDCAQSLINIAHCLQALGRYAEALPVCESALAAYQRSFPADHPDVAGALNNLAMCLSTLGRYADALPKYEASLAMSQRMFGEEGLEIAAGMNRVASCLRALGRAPEALPMFEASLAMYQRLHGGDHRDLALAMGGVAHCLESLGRSAEALAIAESAADMCGRLYPGDHADKAAAINNIAYCLMSLGRLSEALETYEQSLSMTQRLFAGDDVAVARALNNVAHCLEQMGRPVEALPKYDAALAMYRRLYEGDGGDDASETPAAADGDVDHPDIARGMNNIAHCLVSLGRSGEALPQYEAALAMYRRLYDGNHPEVARTLNNVAFCLGLLERTDEALPMYEAALAAYRAIFPTDHPAVAMALNNVGYCLENLGRYSDALPRYRESLAMYQKLYPDPNPPEAARDHPDIARGMHNVARCLHPLGQLNEALPLYEAALAMRQRLFDADHPDVAGTLSNVALLYAAMGQVDQASARLLESSRAKWRHLTRSFPTMSSPQKRQFLSHNRFRESEMLLDLVFRGGDSAAAVGMRAALLNKQLLFEVARHETAALLAAQADAPQQWQALWQRRERLRRQYATLAMQGMVDQRSPDAAATVDAQRLRELIAEIDALEQELRQTNPAYALEARLAEVTLEDVARALRPGEALIEYVRYRRYDFAAARWEAQRYGAFVVLGGSGEVIATDLGDAADIDAAVHEFQRLMRESIERFASLDPSRRQVRQSESAIAASSAQLRAKVWTPLEAHLVGVERVCIAPDGPLSLVPFEAMAQEADGGGWQYLAEQRAIFYVNTGRDLGRLALSRANVQEAARTAVLIGNPDFDAPARQIAAAIAGLVESPAEVVREVVQEVVEAATLGSSTLGSPILGSERRHVPRQWGRYDVLEQLIADAQQSLEQLGWSVSALTGVAASEEAALAVRGPRILQFATHGYIIDGPEAAHEWDNPLLRSMLILAGMNRWEQSSCVFYRVGEELLTEAEAQTRNLTGEQMRTCRVDVADGVLTAYEVSGMNLRGTELVNLTACETGLGVVSADGVAGLRQAFLLAGARSITMSMWEVPALETTRQVAEFYQRWLSGAEPQPLPRYEAFRAAQLAALERSRSDRGGGHPFYWAGVVYVGDPGDLPVSPPAASAPPEKTAAAP